MSNFDIIIPLGESCNISFLLQSSCLKKETSLFEWFVSKNLYVIADVLHNLAEHIETPLIHIDKCNGIGIGSENIWSGHYLLEEFSPIYARRLVRLYDSIKNNKHILFVRFIRGEHKDYVRKESDDDTEEYTYDFYSNFLTILQKINPDISEIKFLIIHHKPNSNYVNHPFIIYKYYEDISVSDNDMKLSNSDITRFFINCLRDVGYNINETNYNIFTDKSDT